ncbi:unnamed protein product [Penicillium salamii]|uniref:Nephrocystin 3-like N-terminal domain-containing protein n=1 Tax=Penicillium salamii TaxID=1612424 RepID=A0A9W4JDL7_9EURO|nr:unnamed protein product [Penicillium salamii]
MLKVLLFQLLRRRKSDFERSLAEDDLIKRYPLQAEARWSFESLLSTFKELITKTNLDTLYCIIDSLDEGDEEHMDQILKLLCHLSKQSGETALKFVLTSRLERHLRIIENLPPRPYYPYDQKYWGTLRMDSQIIGSELTTFVQWKLLDVMADRGLDISAVEAKLVPKVVKKAQGVFLWAKLAIDSLRNIRGLTMSSLETHLLSRHNDFDDFYQEILTSVQNESNRSTLNANLVQQAFSWLIFGARAMNLAEFSIALALNSNVTESQLNAPTEPVCIEPLIGIRDDLEKLCGSFIEFVAQEDGDHAPDDVKTFVHFIHESVKEFVVRQSLGSQNSSQSFLGREAEVHGQLAVTCLAYLSSAEFSGGSTKAKDKEFPQWTEAIEKKLNCHHFLRYAALHWVKHFEASLEQGHNSLVAELVVTFFNDKSPEFESWYEVFQHYQEGVEDCPYRGLHAAAAVGSLGIMTLLLDRGADFEAKSDDGFTPAFMAARYGDEEMVALLAKRGANLNTSNDEGYTALHFAASNGHVTIVETLIQNGAKINIPTNDGLTALHLAVVGGKMAVMEYLLMQLKAGATASTDDGFTAMHFAAMQGHLDTITVLIKEGADINSSNDRGKTPLHLAAAIDHPTAVKLFVQEGADLGAKTEDGYTPVGLAIRNGNSSVIETMIQLGIDVNDATVLGEGERLIHFAAACGKEGIVELLIRHGEDPSSMTANGYAAIHRAAENGQTTIIKLLIEKGVDVDAVAIGGNTTLHAAASGGDEASLEFLIQRGANVNAIGPEKNDTSVQCSVWWE